MTAYEIVEKTLRAIPETRESDHKLLYAVYRKMGMDKDESFKNVIRGIMDGKYPSMASVTRAKRKAVEKYPELDCSAQVREKRNELEKQYKAFARG